MPFSKFKSSTIKAPAKIDVEADCVALHNAVKDLGTDENAIIDILGHRRLDQRLQIRAHYKAAFGKDLVEQMEGELSSHFKDLVNMLLDDTATINARALFKAIKGAGTDEKAIIEILCTSTCDEIAATKEAYLKVLASEGVSNPSRTLESDIEDELSGYLKRLVVALLQGQRRYCTACEVGSSRADIEKDVQDLYDAGEGRLGTDEATFIRIFATRNMWEVIEIAKVYEEKTGKSLMEAIDSETSGDFQKALQLTLFTTMDPIRTYSILLKNSMEGLGTKDSTLMRIIVTRSELDLAQISLQFERDQGTTLAEWISSDTSGDYRKLLLTLLGAE